MDWTFRISDVLTVLATLLSPFIAVQASEYLRAKSASREARENLFHVLMGTRGARMTPDHVAALNRIDLVFPTASFAEVSDAWNLYLHYLSKAEPSDPLAREAYFAEGNRLFFALLKVMASAVNTPFSDTTLQHNAYYPKGYVFNEMQGYELRAATLKVLKGEQPIAIKPSEQQDAQR